MMKKILLLPVVIALFACCSQGNSGTAQAPSLDTAGLVQRVNDIYDAALAQYSEADPQETAEPSLNVDSMFCSADWCSMVKQIKDIDKQNADGMIGFFEADYWIMAQDWGKLSVGDVHVATMTDSIAAVELNLHNLENVTAVRLEMVKESGVWKIDNFIDLKNDFDWKAGMKDYLKQMIKE